MLQPLQTIMCEKIVQEIPTSGSSPLLIWGSDLNFHFTKTCKADPPRVELINELLCAYLAQCWSLKVPDFSIVEIDKSVVEAFILENGSLSDRYRKLLFPSLFFASQKLEPAIELDKYFNGLKSKADFRPFNSPLDLVKIGVFDLWIGNKDRKVDNPNILISGENKFEYCPIDHAAAFAYCTDYKEVSEVFMFLEEKFRILKHPLIKSIAQISPQTATFQLKDEIYEGMRLALNNLDFIFEQIPASWGFSKKAKSHLKGFLSNDARNRVIAESYVNYLN